MSGVHGPLPSPALPPSSLVSPAADQSRQVEDKPSHIGPFHGSLALPKSETTQKTKGCSQPILSCVPSEKIERARLPKRMTRARSPVVNFARPAPIMATLKGAAAREAMSPIEDNRFLEQMLSELAAPGQDNSQSTRDRTSEVATDILSNNPSKVLNQPNPTANQHAGQPSRPSPPSGSRQTSAALTQPHTGTDTQSPEKPARPVRSRPAPGASQSSKPQPDMKVIRGAGSKLFDNLQSTSSDRTNGALDSEDDPLAAINRLADDGAAAPTKSDMSIGTGPAKKTTRPGPKSTRRASQGQQPHMSGLGRPKNKPSGNLQSTSSSDRTNGAPDSGGDPLDPLAAINQLSLKTTPDVGPAPIRERPARSPDERQTLGTLEHHEVLQQEMPKAGGEPKVKPEESPDKSTSSNGLISGLKTFFGRLRR